MKKGDLEFYNKAVDQTKIKEPTLLQVFSGLGFAILLSLMFIGGIWLSVIEIIK